MNGTASYPKLTQIAPIFGVAVLGLGNGSELREKAANLRMRAPSRRVVGFLLRRNYQVDSAVPVQSPSVQLDDNLLHRFRHSLEIPLPTTVNGVDTLLDHIAMPVGAFPTGRRLRSPDRDDLVRMLHCRGLSSHAHSRAGDHASSELAAKDDGGAPLLGNRAYQRLPPPPYPPPPPELFSLGFASLTFIGRPS